MSMHALLLSDEPLTTTAGLRRLVEGGFEVELAANVAGALARLARGGVALLVVDLDHSAGIGPQAAAALMNGALAHATAVLAIGVPSTELRAWPRTATKPFTAEQARAWRAAAQPRLGMCEATPVSLERLTENLGGSEADALDMLRDYAAMALAQHHALRAAIADEDWPRVAEVAHRVCGSLGAIEARETAFTCRQLMGVSRTGTPDEARRLAVHVLALLDRVEASLDRHRARDASAPPLALGA